MRDMLGRDDAVSAEEALRLVLDNIPPRRPSERRLPLGASVGRVLSRDVVSAEDLPPFPRSTVDGFAVRSADTFGASEGNPAYLTVSGEIPMGRKPGLKLKEGAAAKIATGGMLPDGSDSVVMFEHIRDAGGETIEALRAVAPGENVIQRGEDVKEGDTVLQAGRRLRPEDAAVLSGVGITEVFVYGRPKVSILSTGDEILPEGAPLEPGLVRDMNSVNLAGLVAAEGGVPLKKGIFKDDYALIKHALEISVGESHIVLISGGSSVGQKDMTPAIFGEMGRVLFRSVSQKPGKPLIAAVARETLLFGLPGHPRAVTVCFQAFVSPALRRIAGITEPFLLSGKSAKTVGAKLLRSVHSGPGRREYFSVSLEEIDGELWARPLLGKSGLITTVVRAHGTIVIPANKLGVEKGETVEVRVIDPL